MPSGAQGVLGNWAGLRRDIAAYALGDESPATVDAAHYNDVATILGPRRGCVRRYNSNANLIGIIPYTFAFQAGRIVSDDGGNWTAVTSPAAPGPSVPAPISLVTTIVNSLSCSSGSIVAPQQTLSWDSTGRLISAV